MISTLQLKQAQLRDGCFRSGNGPEKILVMGSCRSVPYVSYLMRANEMTGGAAEIRYIDPFSWHWNLADERVDFEATINALETDERVLSVLRSTTVFLHENYRNFGMFSISPEAPKNVYLFGMNPRINVCIPNYNDVFILRNDFAAYGDVPDDYAARGEAAVEKFCALCALTSFPEMADHFRDNWRKTRFFWRPNHVSAAFTMFIFRQMNDRFLNLPLTDAFWQEAAKEDLFKSPCTEVAPEDVANYRLEWNR